MNLKYSTHDLVEICYTEKSKHVEELIHQYFEGLVKDIQTVDSVISYN
jgi:hypothetical protein